MAASELQRWLTWLETLHPQEIDLGLARITTVADRLGLRSAGAPIVTVAGTNGKGSTVACLDAMYRAAGRNPGSYTSPHLLRYNERIRIAGEAVDDDHILAAFRAIDTARGDITLTYFEFATLAAAWCFREHRASPWIMEVGLGGRLDATNCLDADLAVITPIDLDHMEWLGDNREAIAGEKMGIARSGRPVVCADPDPPARIAERARALGSPLWQLGRDFSATARGEGSWSWQGPQGERLDGLTRPRWLPDAALGNAAGAVMAVAGAHPAFRLDIDAIRAGLANARLAGRHQAMQYNGHAWLLDVGHNPAAIALLAERLAAHQAQGRVRLVFALMRRKAPEPLFEALVPVVDEWFLLDLDDPQSHSPGELRAALEQQGGKVIGVGTAPEALAAVGERMASADLAVAAGSFRVVEAFLRSGPDPCNGGGPG